MLGDLIKDAGLSQFEELTVRDAFDEYENQKLEDLLDEAEELRAEIFELKSPAEIIGDEPIMLKFVNGDVFLNQDGGEKIGKFTKNIRGEFYFKFGQQNIAGEAIDALKLLKDHWIIEQEKLNDA